MKIDKLCQILKILKIFEKIFKIKKYTKFLFTQDILIFLLYKNKIN